MIVSIFIPLIGFIFSGFFAVISTNKTNENYKKYALIASLIANFSMLISVIFVFIASFSVFREGFSPYNEKVFEWFSSGSLTVEWGIYVSPLTVAIMLMITVVSFCIHIYSVGYMENDRSQARFLSYLNLFTFFMLVLVSATNLVQFFLGWEGVGLVSYLLIGFWYKKESANKAAIKAFVVNRVGDFAFLLGLAMLYVYTGTLEIQEIFSKFPQIGTFNLMEDSLNIPASDLITMLLFFGAMGKSAQIGLHVWLPDAMEGPTPISALIHAATMVTAGVFMVTRLSPLFEYSQFTLDFITIIGSVTALFAATIAVCQYDIKKIIAYSTMSQLGYMFLALGVSGYSAGMYHLITHGFFKALLFLVAGCLIHGVHGEQDIRKMGGLAKLLPISYVLFWIGNLALAGIPPFSGYFSKDTILELAWTSQTSVGHFGYWLGTMAVFLTAFYSWRLLFLVFHGNFKGDEQDKQNIHKESKIMWYPLIPLAIGATVLGFIAPVLIGEHQEEFWKNSILVLERHVAMSNLENEEMLPFIYKILPLILSVSGIALAYIVYVLQPNIAAYLKQRFSFIHKILENKYYVDEIYQFIFVSFAFVLSRFLFKKIEEIFFNIIGPRGVGYIVARFSEALRFFESGFVFHYAFIMFLGILSLLTWFLFLGV